MPGQGITNHDRVGLITGTGQGVTKWVEIAAEITKWKNELKIRAGITNRCITSMSKKTRSQFLCKKKF